MNSWGLIEVFGYTPAIAAANAMMKAAEVHLAGTEVIGGGMVTVAVTGEIAKVRTAVDAGVAAAQKIGEVHNVYVLARPKEGAEKVLNINME